jgi:hypothetical protein
MLNTYTLFLFALLAAPPDAPAPAFPAELLPHLQAVAVQLELVDPVREKWFFPSPRHHEFIYAYLNNLGCARERWAELRDAPSIADADRLPLARDIGSLVEFNVAYRQHLTNNQPLFLWDRDRHCDALRETEAIRSVLDIMMDARNDNYYVAVRRRALLRLRGALGPEVYYAGEFDIPPAPLRFFRWDH